MINGKILHVRYIIYYKLSNIFQTSHVIKVIFNISNISNIISFETYLDNGFPSNCADIT